MLNLKSNIAFNFLGSAWLGVLTVAVTPIHVHFLGIEAFGFVGLITMLQVLLNTLDLGISVTVTKVVSSDRSDGYQSSAKVMNTASTMYWLVALLIGVFLWFNASCFTEFWLETSQLNHNIITLGIQIVAVYLGLRWPVAFYSGVINGLQRHDVLNLVRACTQTLRLVGGVIVLFFLPNLIAFLTWFAVSSIVELLVYIVVTYRLLPTLRFWPSFSLKSFRDVWKYSFAMNVIAITALVLSQLDRLAVSKLLSLEAFGYYSVAYSASIVISLIQTSINSASFPAFSHSFSGGDVIELISRYDKVSHLMGLVVALPCFILIFFGHEILLFWIGTTVADEVSVAMMWLAIGFFLNAMVSNAYIIAVACGQPNLPLKVNALAMGLYLPALYWSINQYGIVGAAAAYAGLNAYYVFTLVPLVQSRVIKQSFGSWLRSYLIPSLLAGVGAFGSVKALSLYAHSSWQSIALLALGVGIYGVISWLQLPNFLKKDFLKLSRKWF